MDYVILELVKGIGPVVGDTASAEQPIDTLNLMNVDGFAVADNGWIPNFPQVKGGGLYADSPVSDGKVLVAAQEDNVTETMSLKASAATFQSRYALQRKLAVFGEAARLYHTTRWQTEPVYLKAKFSGAPGPQYTLIFTIAMAQRADPFGLSNFNELTITIEREHGWRSIAPGKSGLEWTYQFRHTDYTASDLSLITGTTKHLIYKVVQNRREWNSTQTAELSSNYVDIPASDIPGDMPALLCLNVEAAGVSNVNREIFIARSTKPTSAPLRSGGTRYGYNILNAGDSDGANVLDSEAPISASQSTGQLVDLAATGVGSSQTMTWGKKEAKLDTNLFRGTYACFLRGHQDGATTGTAKLRISSGSLFINGNEVVVATAPTAKWGVTYLGQFSIPYGGARVAVASDGLGLEVAEAQDASASDANLLISLICTSKIAGTNNFRIADLIMIPVEEAACQIINTGSSTARYRFVDNTGHFAHGGIGEVALAFEELTSVIIPGPELELRGRVPTLLPGINNRLYFWGLRNVGFTHSPIDQELTIRGNIVPRWRGIRDT